MEEGQASAAVENVENVKNVENVEKGNEEIDIYVFSNGQQYSPPRKYHLRADELNTWEATLSFLARSQYGSLHSSIELYELDGRKLEKPTDVRDCAVYVAVVPPDPFIYAGYDKYLVKASRSYERRFSKIINGEQADSTDANSRPKDVNTASVRVSDIRPQYLPIRKWGEERRSSLKNSSQKLMEKIKPVANQVSQRQPRKSNIFSSDLATKKNYNSKRDPKICSKISIAPGIPGKSSTSTRGGSVATRKSPAKTLSFDTSAHKENDTHQKSVNSKHESFNINKNCQDPSNKPNTPTSFRTSKLNNNASIIKKEKTLFGRKDSIVDEFNPHLDKPHILLNNTRKSVNEIPKPSMKQRSSAIGKIAPLLVDDKLQSTKKDRISFTDAITLPEVDKTQGLLVRPIPMSNIETSSVKVQIEEVTSNERASTANETLVSKRIREFNDRLNASRTSSIPKSTSKNKASTVNENKLTATDEMLILTDNRQSPVINKTSESIEKQIEIELLDDLLSSTVRHENSVISKPFISFSDEMKETNNRDCICKTNETEEKSFKDQNDVSKTTTTFSQLQTAKSIEISTAIFKDVSNIDGKDRILLINKTKNYKRDDSTKANLDLISILNETRMSTEPQSFILKSEEARGSKSKERFIIINDTVDQAIKPNSNHNYIMQKSRALAVCETTKTNTDPITPVDKINVSTVEATPKHEYVNISGSNQKNKIITNSNSTLHTDGSQTNNNKNPSLVSENVYDLKVPMLYHVPEKTLKLIAQDGNADTGALTKKSAPGITIETENMYTTKKHSFTLYVKKDSDNIVKVTDIKSNIKKQMVKSPLNDIVKNKDIVNIDIFSNSINHSMSTCVHGTDNKPCEMQKCKDETNNDMKDGCPSECNQCLDGVPLKETDMTTTFINPAWDKNNANVSLKTESDADQFIAMVQNGDVVNLKLSFQIDDAAGITKSTHEIDIRKSSSVNHLPSDEINKTPNELTRSKSLQSVENDSPPHLCCRKKDKVVIYQCACCENTNYTLPVNPLNPSLQGLYVLLPVVVESVRTNNQTSDKQVQHTESPIKISVVSSFPGDHVQARMSEISSRRQVLIGDQGTIHSQLIMMKTEPSQMSTHYIMESKIQQTSTTTKDEFTQTDWCDVLLEARAEPDGHYTFYFPPLHLLQQYTLQ